MATGGGVEHEFRTKGRRVVKPRDKRYATLNDNFHNSFGNQSYFMVHLLTLAISCLDLRQTQRLLFKYTKYDRYVFEFLNWKAPIFPTKCTNLGFRSQSQAYTDYRLFKMCTHKSFRPCHKAFNVARTKKSFLKGVATKCFISQTKITIARWGAKY